MSEQIPKQRATIHAAGGVLWRGMSDGRYEVALVHRGRYDDWSLPKGKSRPGEHPLVTAVREVSEETGWRGVVGARLPFQRYAVPGPHGPQPKTVRYWAMEGTDGRFEENAETDSLSWLAPDKALSRLTWPGERKIITHFDRLPRPTVNLVVVRHAMAGKRSAWTGQDELRPLDATGRAEAEVVASILQSLAITRIYSSHFLRCMQTIGPFAQGSGVPILIDHRLSESGFAVHPEATRDFLHAIGKSITEPTVLCSQGRVIPFVLPELCTTLGGQPPHDPRVAKGAMWVMTLRGDRLIQTTKYRPIRSR